MKHDLQQLPKHIAFIIDGNFHLGELLRKKKVSFFDLLNMYEDDSANATILFYEKFLYCLALLLAYHQYL